MRYLTIKRHKSLIGWAVQLRIYIEDPFSPELDICGVPCKLLGIVKNNEERSFPIGLESRRVFLVPQVKSRDLYNTPFTIPFGQENVFVAGKFCQENGLMPFRLDGIEPTTEQLEREKKMKKRSIIISVIVFAVLMGLLFVLRNMDFGTDAKKFSKGDFSITLTEEFRESQYDEFYAVYESDMVAVMVLQEQTEPGWEASQYFRSLEQLGADLHQKDSLVWISFTEDADGLTYYYESYFFENEDTFWTVMFGVPVGKQDEYASEFFKWAKSVELAQQI